MSTTMQVDHLAEKIKTPTKATFLTSIFKKGLKKKLNHVTHGHISVVDGSEKFSFGDSGSELIGSLMIMEFPNLYACEEFWRKEPLNYAGVFNEVIIKRWAYGKEIE